MLFWRGVNNEQSRVGRGTKPTIIKRQVWVSYVNPHLNCHKLRVVCNDTNVLVGYIERVCQSKSSQIRLVYLG